MSESSKAKKARMSSLIDTLKEDRKNTAESVLDFVFNKKRIRVLTELDEVAENCNGVLYWMFRDARVQDNWALLFAQKTALKNKVPLYVCFCILPKFLDATIRHYKFLLKGLEEVEAECKSLNINFTLLHGEPYSVILEFVKKYKIGAVVTDFFPLKLPMFWVNYLKNNLPKNVPLCQVDAHNIVPCWITSDKQEYSARTIRNKINSKLDEFLTPYPPLMKHPHTSEQKLEKIDWKTALKDVKVDRSVDEVIWAKPGYEGGILELESFLKDRLDLYNIKRNDPTADALSNLSPWFHFGMISVQRCILEAKKLKKKHKESVEAFMEEAIIRSELGDNFCFYNEHYDSIKGASQWAIDTLDAHRP